MPKQSDRVELLIPGLKRYEVQIDVDEAVLTGDLSLMTAAKGVVLFAHGSGSGRKSPRNQFVANALQVRGIATLLIDLLTLDEEREDEYSGHLRFDIGMLADRLHRVTRWLETHPDTSALPIGYFGASTGAAAALIASVQSPSSVKSIVSRGGRPDLAAEALCQVVAPTLFIVGSLDTQVITLNEQAFEQLRLEDKKIAIIDGAHHLFEEPGKLEDVANLAGEWFVRHGMR